MLQKKVIFYSKENQFFPEKSQKIFYFSFIFHFLGVSASDVCLHGLNLIMPLMSAELLKFPSLSLQYFKTITLVCELYPDKICNLNPELQKNLIASLELGKILFMKDFHNFSENPPKTKILFVKNFQA